MAALIDLDHPQPLQARSPLSTVFLEDRDTLVPLAHEHSFYTRVYYEDTDFSGVVYHANYLRFLDRGREHYFGLEKIKNLYDETGCGFVVYRINIKYCQSARFGDELEVVTKETRRSKFRAFLDQKIIRPSDGRTIVKAQVEVALVDSNHKIVDIGI